jgi:class 3 adenylate cyclase
VTLLNQALEVGNELGMPRLVEQALAVKLDLQGVASSSPEASIDVVAAGVSVERPDLRSHAAADGRVTIMFSDIEGYTATTERLGDQRTQELLREHNAVVRREVRAHRGFEVKSAGDGFMLAFALPADALACAVALQQAVTSTRLAGQQIRLRIGLHVGEVIREAHDFYGRTVIMAARVADQARGGEVLVTPEVIEACGITGEPRQLSLKGFSGTFTVYAVGWEATARDPGGA